MANEVVYTCSGTSNQFYERPSGSGQGYAEVGYKSGEVKGAIRFTNVVIPKGSSVSYASLQYYKDYKQGNETIKLKTYGIDEDNTNDFGSYPMGRAQTTAYGTSEISGNDGADLGYHNMDVSNQITEIVGRNGWNSGNALGFFIRDNGTPTDKGDQYVGDDVSTARTKLIIRVDPEPNFLPTPQTIAVPTFPAPSHWGIKISKPGVNVLDATEKELFFTTRKKVMKVLSEGELSTSGGQKDIDHDLGYIPMFLVYADTDDYRFKLPLDPTGDAYSFFFKAGNYVNGYAAAYSDILRIFAGMGYELDFYYYIFIDELG